MPKRISELHCIMPIENVGSVLEYGILCHEGAGKLKHSSVAMDEIQNKRDGVQIPGGLKLHQYANLYFDARNPMMYKRKHLAASICVLRVSDEVMRLDGVVLSDQNASSKYARFFSLAQIRQINFEWVYAEDWRHPEDEIMGWRHKSAKCAEVLVPHAVPVEYIQGVYVVNEEAKGLLKESGLDITVNSHIFFA